jgi:hypothetical protein
MTVTGCHGCAFEPDDKTQFYCYHPYSHESWFHQQGDVTRTCYYDYKSFNGNKIKIRSHPYDSSAEKGAGALLEELGKILNSRIAKMEILDSQHPSPLRKGILMAYREIEEWERRKQRGQGADEKESRL